MTTLRLAWLIAAVFALLTGAHNVAAREVQNFNAGWRFAKGEQPDGASPTLADGGWQTVRLPHDWAIAGPFDPAASGKTGKLPWKGEGWYRKRFTLPADADGKRFYLLFDGVMANPAVWINGKRAGGWDYGYNSFWVDATPHVKPGESNVVAVHADTRRHESAGYPGAGIYRKVTLHITEPVHVAHWGLNVRTPQVEEKSATAVVRCRVENAGAQPRDASIVLSLFSPDGESLDTAKPQTQTIPARGSIVVEHKFKVKTPQLWSPGKPTLYRARAEVSDNDGPLDERTERFGFRKIEFTPNYGMYLNGRRLAFKGVNLHHDLGPIGAAFSKPLMRRRLQMLKQMGANALRTSHNPAAPELLDLCDELGLLVVNELFDKWDATADLHDDEKFEPFMRRQVSNAVRRDRNHPCVVAWSIASRLTAKSPEAPPTADRVRFLAEEVKRHDATRPVTMGCNQPGTLDNGSLANLDLLSWKYNRSYATARGRFPKKPAIYIASSATLSTRGYYPLPLAKNKTDFGDTLQLSAYDRTAAPWGDIPDVEFARVERDQYCGGEFVWLGFDCLGQPTPFDDEDVETKSDDSQAGARSSYAGIIDLCGLAKDRYYLYRSHWAPKKTTIHILPHWNWQQGDRVPVCVYTNGDEVELLLNGKSLGRRKKKPKAESGPADYYGVTARYRLVWDDIAFEAGELTAVVYRKGKEIGTATTRTAGDAHQVRVTPRRKSLTNDGDDLCEVLVEVVDENGIVCPTHDDLIRFSITGPATIAGIGNGDQTSLDSFVDNEHRVFHGKAVLLLRSRAGSTGDVRLTASAEGLKPGEAKLKIKKPAPPATKKPDPKSSTPQDNASEKKAESKS